MYIPMGQNEEPTIIEPVVPPNGHGPPPFPNGHGPPPIPMPVVTAEPVVAAEPEKVPGAELAAAFGAGALAGFVGGLVMGIAVTGITWYVVSSG
jgi:hypothetical protein